MFTAKLLEEVIAYAKCFSQNIGHEFTERTILITAMTGSAATDIGGKTTASVFKYLSKNTHASQEEINSFADTRLNIIDEISFACYGRVLAKTSENLQNFTQCYEFQYGSIDIVFLGDFCQLATINGDIIYQHRHGVYWEQELNRLVELKGSHRYRDLFMQRVMSEIRVTGLAKEDRDIFNTRVIGQNGVEMPDPSTIRFATYYNKARCSINAAIFRKYLQQHHSTCTETEICNSAIVIKSNGFWGNSNIPLSYESRKKLFEECSETDTKSWSKQKCDPLLCLFYGSNVMINENSDVSNGIANGTTCLFKKAHLKPGVIPRPMKMHGYWIKSVKADEVDWLELEWQDSPTFVGRFKVFAKKARFTVEFPITERNITVRVATSIALEQFPIVVNFATTGHKLQGKSMIALVIAQWSNVKNWAYVVLSRVRTLVGLFFTTPIPENVDFTPEPEYLDMMANLRETINATTGQVATLKSTYDYSLFEGAYN